MGKQAYVPYSDKNLYFQFRFSASCDMFLGDNTVIHLVKKNSIGSLGVHLEVGYDDAAVAGKKTTSFEDAKV